VIHKTTPEFWDCYHNLPKRVQKVADKNYELLRINSFHPSLHFKEVKPEVWSARAGRDYRALAVEDGEDLLWFWIGHHSEYDKII
jgi:hypothetical protein